MKRLSFVLAASLLLAQPVGGQESGTSCDKQTAAVVIEIIGNCSCRANKEIKQLSPQAKLTAGQELQCPRKSRLMLRLCRTRQDVPIKENAPKWYMVPNVPFRQAIDDPTKGGGKTSQFFSPPNPPTYSFGNKPTSLPTFAILDSKRSIIEELLIHGNRARDKSKYEESEQAYRAVLEHQPTNARALYGLGNLYTEQQEWKKAERAYRKALGRYPQWADPPIALSFVLLQTDIESASHERIIEAEMLARRAADLQPSNAVALDLIGQAMEARGLPGNETEAEQLYRRAIRLDRRKIASYIHLSDLLRKTGRPAEASMYLQLAGDMAREVPVLLLVAEKLFASERFAESQKPLRRLLRRNPKNHAALFLIGQALSATGEYDKAIVPLKSLIKETPNDFAVYDALGWAYLVLSRAKKAEQVFSTAMTLQSISDSDRKAIVEGFIGVGDVYNNSDRLIDALRAYERAEKIGPGNIDIEHRLANLRELLQYR